MITKVKSKPVNNRQGVAKKRKAPPKMPKPMTMVMESKTWYKDQYRRSTLIILVLSFILLGSLSLNVVQLFLKEPPVYFAATRDLRLAPMTPLSEPADFDAASDVRLTSMAPLDQPAITKGGVVDWTSGVVRDTLTLNFLDYKKQLSGVKDNYFNEAYTGLLKSLEKSGILPIILSKRLNLKTTIPESPVITASGILNGRYSYKVEFPAILSYESSNGIENTQKIIAKVLVQRVPVTVNHKAVQIRQLILGYQ
ncbi:MAG: hypothetical protein GY729_12150 [Desulfobacteraceae bacterium]|nr:hypothetical protein [Desulfobacteraceae bacterium]